MGDSEEAIDRRRSNKNDQILSRICILLKVCDKGNFVSRWKANRVIQQLIDKLDL